MAFSWPMMPRLKPAPPWQRRRAGWMAGRRCCGRPGRDGHAVGAGVTFRGLGLPVASVIWPGPSNGAGLRELGSAVCGTCARTCRAAVIAVTTKRSFPGGRLFGRVTVSHAGLMTFPAALSRSSGPVEQPSEGPEKRKSPAQDEVSFCNRQLFMMARFLLPDHSTLNATPLSPAGSLILTLTLCSVNNATHSNDFVEY